MEGCGGGLLLMEIGCHQGGTATGGEQWILHHVLHVHLLVDLSQQVTALRLLQVGQQYELDPAHGLHEMKAVRVGGVRLEARVSATGWW